MSCFIVAVLSSCNYGETLQSYYVINQVTPSFISVDVPVSFVNFEESALTDIQLEAYESIDKLNMLHCWPKYRHDKGIYRRDKGAEPCVLCLSTDKKAKHFWATLDQKTL